MKLLISCPFWLGSLLANELKKLHFQPFGTFASGTFVETNLEGLYQINLCSRIANKVWIQLTQGSTKTFDQLFDVIKKSSYGQRSTNSSLSIKVETHNSQLNAVRSIQSVAHKALLESISRSGKEKTESNELLLSIDRNISTLYLNSSWASLHQRWWRQTTGVAPMKENLAAALVILSWRKFKMPLFDPFCGSGTIGIEALLLAKNIAPGLRRSFAFEHFDHFDPQLWQRIKSQAESRIFENKYEIYLSDKDPKMVAITHQNLETRWLKGNLEVNTKDFRVQSFPQSPHWLISNPPYGKRLVEHDLQHLYKDIMLTFNAPECFGGILSSFTNFHQPDPEFWSEKKLFNGEEECRFLYKKVGK